jgi:D-psicose/D-tagatose/L-ribulose 3-epimerase
MNPIGVHALVWVGGWSEEEARLAIDGTARLGFDLIEIPLLDPGSVDAGMTRRLLEEHDLQATCSLGLEFSTDISSEDPKVVRRGEELLISAVETAADIGSEYLGGVTYSAMGKYLEPPTTVGRRHCIEALGRVAERAGEHGITIGLEAVNRYESNLVNTAQQAVELIEEAGAGNLVVHLDSYHMHIEEGDMSRPVTVCGDRLGYVHLGESHRGYLGTGLVDFPTLFRALARAGYDGPLVFESFSSAVVSERFASALAVWRDLWDDGEDLARQARAFIEQQWAAARRVA